MESVTIIGGGLAGSEAAWQIAQRGIHVDLFEMRPDLSTGAHFTPDLAELVCSNSLGSTQRNKASGLIKEELSLLGSLLLACAKVTAIPAGTALAVDRHLFAEKVTHTINNHPNITLHRQEVTIIPPGPTIIASGPLTSTSLSKSIQDFVGSNSLYFFDAISPTVEASSINMDIAFKASRYKFDEGPNGDYINCPMDEIQYENFTRELLNAQTIQLHDFELDLQKGVKTSFFEACLPIEILARRNPKSLSYGPMRPVGIHNPHTEEKPRAVVQLRQEDLAETLFNLVGFQTNLTFTEQDRVFRLIPGLENAHFTRFGQMHRNTYINSPMILNATLQTRSRPDLFFAGQIVGIEGYMGNIASGLVAGLNMVRFFQKKDLLSFPVDTMIGALHNYIVHSDSSDFQPMKANFGLLPPIPQLPKSKPERGFIFSKRALHHLKYYLSEIDMGEA
jgi:methylenetetrahydrofolate--tRNA-(uracil-5-)-methyltransferase